MSCEEVSPPDRGRFYPQNRYDCGNVALTHLTGTRTKRGFPMADKDKKKRPVPPKKRTEPGGVQERTSEGDKSSK
jgi:hypothetical protein